MTRGLRDSRREILPIGIRFEGAKSKPKAAKDTTMKGKFNDRRGQREPSNPQMIVVARSRSASVLRRAETSRNRKHVKFAPVSPPSRSIGSENERDAPGRSRWRSANVSRRPARRRRPPRFAGNEDRLRSQWAVDRALSTPCPQNYLWRSQTSGPTLTPGTIRQ